MTLQLSLFGPFAAALDGRDLKITSRRSQAMLAMLALSPKHSIARDRLAATLWPDRGEEQARASLRQELSSLRKACGRAETIISADGQYVRLDVQVLDPDFGSPDEGGFLEAIDLMSEPFDDWCRETAARLDDGNREESDVSQAVSEHDIFTNPTVLVAALVAASTSEEDQAFATGLVVDLRTCLSTWRWFPVIGPEAVGWQTEQDGNLREIATSVHADYAVSGAIRRAGDRIRVSASLTEVATGHLIWTETFDGDMSDVFEIQEAIGRCVVARFTPEIARAEAARVKRQRPSDMSAWQLVAQADEIERNGGAGYGSPESNALQVPLYEEALRREPNYTQALARLSRFWFRSALLGWNEDRTSSMERARALAEQAVDSDPMDWESHGYLALTLIFGEHSFGPGKYHATEAVRLNPSAPIARHALGCSLEWLGEFDEAMRQNELLLQLNPNYPNRAAVLGQMATCLLFSGQVEEATRIARELRDIAPSYSRGLQRVAITLGLAGAIEEAEAALQKVHELQPDFDAAYVAATYPYAQPEHKNMIFDGLHRAGWTG